MASFSEVLRFCALAGIVTVATGTSFAADWYVNAVNGSDSNSGTSAGQAYKTINKAMSSASDNADTIWLAPGVYGATEGATPYSDLAGNDCGFSRIVVKKLSLTIKASGSTPETIIEGSQTGNGVRPILIDALATGALIEGITLRNGKGIDGGAVYDDSGYALVSKCVVENNYAESCGGGGYGGEYSDCVFTGNYAGDSGGATYYSRVNGGSVIGNKAWRAGGGVTGGTVSGVIIAGNTAQENGGGASDATLTNCIIGGNTAMKSGGGTTWSYLTNCTVLNNTAYSVGGGCNEDDVKNSIVWDNTLISGEFNNYANSNFQYSCTKPAVSGVGNVDSNPMWIKPTVGDVHLGSGSLCVNSASSIYAPSRDFSGQLRGTTPDMGALESGYTYGKGTVTVSFNVTGSTASAAVEQGAKWRHALTNAWKTESASLTEVPSGIVPIVANSAFGFTNSSFGRLNLASNGSLLPTLSYTKGADYYVNGTSGNDSNNGLSASTPFKTITKALSTCTSGATINVAAGTYGDDEGRTMMLVGKSEFGYSRLVVKTQNVLIKSSGSAANTSLLGVWHIADVIAVGAESARCISAYPNCPVRLEGFSLIGGATDNYGGAAMNVDLKNCAVTGNRSAWYGGGAYYCALTNCLVSGNTAGWDGGGAYSSSLMNCSVFGNTTYANGGGVYGGFMTNSVVWGNTLADGTTEGNYFGGGWQFSCTTPIPPSNVGEGNISTDPKFTLAASGNVYPSAGSPLINAGTSTGAPTVDLLGNARSGAPDMGCYESSYSYTSGSVKVVLQANGGITVDEIIAAGAKWRLTNSSNWHMAAATLNSVMPGTYTVEASPAFGYRAQGATAVVTGNAVTEVSVVYMRSSDWYVSVNAGNDLNDGSVNHPFKTVRQALTVVQPGDVIWLAEGTYGDTEGYTVISDGTTTLGKSRIHVSTPYVTLRGRGAVNNVIIAGRWHNPETTALGDDAIRCVSAEVGVPVVFDNLTLSGGATPEGIAGGGAYLDAADAELKNCVISSNHAANGGGVVGGYLTNSIIKNNAANYGGGLYASDAVNCTLSGNNAKSEGGAAYLGSLEYCIASDNTSENYGGGVSNGSVFDSELSKNDALLYGGGLYYCYTVSDCTISENTALYGGGIYGGRANSSEIAANIASGGWGGGSYSAELINCLVTGNNAANGAGSYIGILTNCTVSGNIGTTGAGSYDDIVENSIVWGNATPAGSAANYVSGMGSFIYSCTTPLPVGTGNISGDPLFTSVAQNNYQLRDTSPCIAKASSSAAPDTDILGRVRKATPDMGAYETVGAAAVGSVIVTITPSAAVTAGAMFSLNNGKTWNASGVPIGSLTVGNYTVTYKAIVGWDAPSPVQMVVEQGFTTRVSAIYQNNFDLALNSGDFTAGVVTPLAPGAKVDFRWNVSANVLTADRFWCEIFASKTGGFDQVRFGSTVTNSYRQTGLQTLTQSIAPSNQVLKTLPDGMYSLVPIVNRASLDASVRVNESNYVNNWDTIAGKRMRIRNTTVSDIDLQIVGEPVFTIDSINPNKVKITGTVKNSGSADLNDPGCWIEVFYGSLTAEGTLVSQGTISAGQLISSLPAGAETSFSISGTVSAGVAKRALAVIVDSTDIVPEKNEVNNSKLWYEPGIIPAPKDNGIDFVLSGMTIDVAQLAPNQVSPGDKLKYSVTVKNNGTVSPSEKIWVELFASQDGGVTFMRGATATASDRLTLPGAGLTKTFNLEQAINAIGDGMYTLVAVVNRDGAGLNPGDITPTNNRYAYAVGRISLMTPSNSGTQNIIWSEGPYFEQNGSKMTVTGQIKNVGSSTSRSFWTEAFVGKLQSGTGFFTREKELAGGVLCNGLAANATLDISITGNITSGKVVGIIADSTDLVAETDETDNYDYSNLTH